MKKHVISATIVALIFLNIASVYVVQLGVKSGDWIKLSVTATTTGNSSGIIMPTWMKVEFLNVTGTIVTARITIHSSDGKEQNGTSTYDLSRSSTGGASLSGFAIPADSKAGDMIYIDPYGNVTIMGETTGIYAWASRTVLYANFSSYGNQQIYYWDKQTGVLAESIAKSAGITVSLKLTETNMWPPVFLYVLLAVIAVIVVVCAVLIMRRRKKHQPSKEVVTATPTVPRS